MLLHEGSWCGSVRGHGKGALRLNHRATQVQLYWSMDLPSLHTAAGRNTQLANAHTPCRASESHRSRQLHKSQRCSSQAGVASFGIPSICLGATEGARGWQDTTFGELTRVDFLSVDRLMSTGLSYSRRDWIVKAPEFAILSCNTSVGSSKWLFTVVTGKAYPRLRLTTPIRVTCS